jgi:O-antigen/teichoic acid export membrane protein
VTRSILAGPDLRHSPIARGIFASYLNTLVGIACNLVLVPLYLASLGRDEYGLWMTVSGLVAYLTLLNLGIVQTTSVRFAAAVVRGEMAQASRVLATGLWSYVALAAAALAFLFVAGPWLPWNVFVKGTPTLERQVTVIIVTAAAGFLVELPLGVFAACLRAIGRVDLQQAVAVLQNLGRVVAAVLFLRAGGALWGLIIVLSLVNILSYVLNWICLQRDRAGLRMSVSLWDAGLARAMRSHSSYYFLLQIAGAILFGSDTVIISAVLGTSLVPPYAIAQRLSSIALGVVSTIGLNFAPSFLETHARGDTMALGVRFRQAMAISIVVGVLASAGLIVAGPAFIAWWVGPGNFVGRSAFAAIVSLMLVQMVLVPCDQLLVSTAQHKEYALAAAWEAAISVGGGLAVAHVWGLTGIAWVRVIARLVGAGPIMAWRSATILRER